MSYDKGAVQSFQKHICGSCDSHCEGGQLENITVELDSKSALNTLTVGCLVKEEEKAAAKAALLETKDQVAVTEQN